MGFSNERMRTGQLVNWFLLDGIELTPAGYPVTQALSLPFGVDHLIGFNELLTCKHPGGVHPAQPVRGSSGSWHPPHDHRCPVYPYRPIPHLRFRQESH